MEEGTSESPTENHIPPETAELMQSIVLRHNPTDSHNMRNLMTNAGLLSGAYAMAAGLVWWITVAKGGSQLGDSDIPNSLLGLEFHAASIIVPILVLFSTAVFVFGSYRGTPGALLFGGGTALLVAYLIIEPLGLLIVGSIDGDSRSRHNCPSCCAVPVNLPRGHERDKRNIAIMGLGSAPLPAIRRF